MEERGVTGTLQGTFSMNMPYVVRDMYEICRSQGAYRILGSSLCHWLDSRWRDVYKMARAWVEHCRSHNTGLRLTSVRRVEMKRE